MKLALQDDLVVYTNVDVDNDGHVVLPSNVIDRNKYEIMDMVEGVSVGYRFVNGEFVAPEPLPAVVEVPNTITPRQIRFQLTVIGLRQQVEDWVAAQTIDIKDWWEFSTVFERNNQKLIDAAAIFGLTSEQIDQMFIEASQL